MAWFAVDDALIEHRKVRRLGADRLAAVGVWTLCGAWSARHLTDGFVPSEVVQRHDPAERLAGLLVAADLWERATLDGERGYRFHDWSDYQPSREEVLERRRKRAEAGRLGGLAKARARARGPASAVASARASARASAIASDTASDTASALAKRKQSSSKTLPPTPKRTEPPTGVLPTPSKRLASATASASDAQALVGEWLDRCDKRPPGAVIGHLGKLVRRMLDEGVEPDDVRRGLAEWMRKGLHPSTLPSEVNRVMNGQGSYVSPTDRNIAEFMAAGRRLRAVDGGGNL